MADNVAVTAGSGTTIAADEVTDGTLGTVKVQYVKIMDGTLDGTTKATVGAGGLMVNGAAAENAAVVGNPVLSGGRYDSTPRTLGNGDAGAIALNASGHVMVDTTSSQVVTNAVLSAAADGNDKLGVVLYDTGGTAIAPISQAEDSAYTNTDSGMPVLVVRDDAKNVRVSTDGDYGFLSMNAQGDLRVDGGQVYRFENSPTVATSGYVTGDCLGGEIEITNAARATGAGGVITTILCAFQDDTSADWSAGQMQVILFKSNPAGTYTDSTALDLSDADKDEVVGFCTLDEELAGGNTTILQAKNLNIPYLCDATSLWAVIVSRGSATGFDATNALQFSITMIRD